MARTVSVNIRLDENDKKNMEQVCEELGLSMEDAFAIFARKVGIERHIPFDVSIDPFYSQDNIAYMEGIAQDIRDGKARFSEHVIADLLPVPWYLLHKFVATAENEHCKILIDE